MIYEVKKSRGIEAAIKARKTIAPRGGNGVELEEMISTMEAFEIEEEDTKLPNLEAGTQANIARHIITSSTAAVYPRFLR